MTRPPRPTADPLRVLAWMTIAALALGLVAIAIAIVGAVVAR